MRSLRLREQMLLWGLSLVAIVAAFDLLVYSPKTNEAAALTRRLGSQRADAARLQKEAQQKNQVERDTADLRSAVAALEAKFPSAREIPQLLQQLDELADRTEVTVISLKPGALQTVKVPPAAPAGSPRGRQAAASPAPAAQVSRPPNASHASQPETANYQAFTIDLEVKGTFSSTLGFVRGLEEFPRFLALSDMRLTPASLRPAPSRPAFSAFSRPEENPDDPVLVLAITATAYTRPESGGPP